MDDSEEARGAGDLPGALRDVLGHGASEWDPVLRVAPATVRAALPWLSRPLQRGALTPRERALVLLAVDTSSTHRDEPSVRAHVADALDAGATREEVMEVAELASIVGMHTFTFGMPLVREVAEEVLGPDAVAGDAERIAALREARLGGRYWEEFDAELGAFTEAMLHLDPDMLEAYLDYTGRSWRDGALEPWLKELVYVALDVVAEHQYAPGVRLHARNALSFGASVAQLVEVLELVSRQGFQALAITARALEEVDGA